MYEINIFFPNKDHFLAVQRVKRSTIDISLSVHTNCSADLYVQALEAEATNPYAETRQNAMPVKLTIIQTHNMFFRLL